MKQTKQNLSHNKSQNDNGQQDKPAKGQNDNKLDLTEKRKIKFREKYKPVVIEFEENPNKDAFRAIPRRFMGLPDDVSYDDDFRFDKLTYYVKAVYPVLCTFSDFKKKKPIQISQENIGKHAGISPVKVYEATYVLDESGWIKRFKRTEHGRRSWYYNVNFIRSGEQEEKSSVYDYFVFKTWIVRSGLWARLSNKAKTLYLGLLAFSKNDIWNDEHDGGIWHSPEGEIYDLNDEDEYAKALYARNWSDFEGSINDLCRMIGISNWGKAKALEELEKEGLIKIDVKIENRGVYLIKVF